MDDTSTVEPARSRFPAWSQLLLAAILVALVGGAFWLKSRPKPGISGAASQSQEATGSLLARGIQAHNAGSLDAAIDFYHKVLQREPAHPAAHYNIAQIYAHRAQWAEAQWEYEAALKGDPKFRDARLNLGVVLYRQRQFAPAVQAFRQVLEASPNHPLALYDLGLTLVELGQADEAVRVLTAALREDPKRTDIHYNLGLALERQRRFREAKAELLKWLEISPNHADGYVALARVYMAQGEKNLSLQALAKAVQLNPSLKK